MILDDRLATMGRFKRYRKTRGLYCREVAARLLLEDERAVVAFECGQWETIPAPDLSRLLRQERAWAFETVAHAIEESERSNVRRFRVSGNG